MLPRPLHVCATTRAQREVGSASVHWEAKAKS